jgi:hypothetical protein
MDGGKKKIKPGSLTFRPAAQRRGGAGLERRARKRRRRKKKVSTAGLLRASRAEKTGAEKAGAPGRPSRRLVGDAAVSLARPQHLGGHGWEKECASNCLPAII